MAKKDRRVDKYIDSAQDFAKPILRHLRKIIHDACPDVEESMKWNFPHFMHHGILCSMADFKYHCAFGFWKARLLAAKYKNLRTNAAAAMGQFGRITSVKDLPSTRTLTRLIKDAAALNEAGETSPRPERKKKPVPKLPADLLAALRKKKKAQATFATFSASHQREYIEWVTEANREETRKRRVATAVEWIAAGKPRNWKYVKK